MADRDRDRILNRIKKMLALANDAGATEGERDNALRAAYATLAKHNIEMAEVEAAGAKPEENRIIVKAEFFGRPWARNCSSSIADMCFCIYLVTPGRTPRECVNWFIGRESNATSAAELAKYVTQSIWSEGSKLARQRGAGNEFIRNFATAASYEVMRRCMELKAAALDATKQREQGHTPGTALVLASFYQQEKAANQAILNGMQTRTLKSKAKSTHNLEAQAHGREYGKRVSLNRQVTGSTVPKLEEK